MHYRIFAMRIILYKNCYSDKIKTDFDSISVMAAILK